MIRPFFVGSYSIVVLRKPHLASGLLHSSANLLVPIKPI